MKRLLIAAALIAALLVSVSFAGGLQFSKGNWNERIILKLLPGSNDTIVWIVPTEKANGTRMSFVADTAGSGTLGAIDSAGITGTTVSTTKITMTFRYLTLVDSTMARRVAGTPFLPADFITSSGSVDSSAVTLKALYDLNSDTLNITGKPTGIEIIYHAGDTLYVYPRSIFSSN